MLLTSPPSSLSAESPPVWMLISWMAPLFTFSPTCAPPTPPPWFTGMPSNSITVSVPRVP